MIEFCILTLFPDIFDSFLNQSLIKKALEKQKIEIDIHNFREFGIGKHKNVDASPFGGGAGMVLRPEPIADCLSKVETRVKPKKLHKVLITPQGKIFNQSKAKELWSKNSPIALVCGRYEGFDERIRDMVDDEISLGDFIFLGGEVAAMVIIETVSRLDPGVIGNQESVLNESFDDDRLEYAQYTKPRVFQGKKVPDVLLSGDHEKIKFWRNESSKQRTKLRRPDLIQSTNTT